jgi:hypothetical protein
MSPRSAARFSAVKRIEREAKEQAKAKGKGKRGRKRKSPPPESDRAETEAPETEAQEPSKRKRGQKRKSPPATEAGMPEPRTKVACIQVSEPVRAPVVAWTSEVQIAPVARMV